MLVTHVPENEKSVVIGGAKQQLFSIADSAAAYRIMANALYSDKILAVVRETICNATDAHRENGQIDRPIEIKLDGNEFSVTDFGPGIPEDRVAEIYCTLFLSSKNTVDMKNRLMTGGFGLGCKAPLAYTEHFIVTIKNGGFSITYAIHIGDEDSGGRPTIREMVRCPVPAEDTGLTVSVPIGDQADVYRFQQAILKVVHEAGIMALLNGKPIAVPPVDVIREKGYGYIPPVGGTHAGQVRVLYGDVQYPLDLQKLELARDYLEFAQDRHSNLIIVAEPNSIEVTPAREGLSYNGATRIALREKLKEFKEDWEAAYKREAKEIFVRKLKDCEAKRTFVLSDAYVKSEGSAPLTACGVTEMVQQYLLQQINENGLRDYPEQVYGAMRRIFRDKRHQLDQIWREHTTGPVPYWSSVLKMRREALQKDAQRYQLMRVARLARDFKLPTNTIWFRRGWRTELIRVNSSEREWRLGENKVIIARTREEAYQYYGEGLYLISNLISEELKQEIKARGEKLGLNILLAQKIIREEKAKPTEEQKQKRKMEKLGWRYILARYATGGESKIGAQIINYPDQIIGPKPDIYIEAMESGGRGYVFGDLHHTVISMLLNVFQLRPAWAGAKDIKRMKEEGVLDLETWLIKEIKSVVGKKPKPIDAFMYALVQYVNSGRQLPQADWARKSMERGFALFLEPYKGTERNIKLYHLITLLYHQVRNRQSLMTYSEEMRPKIEAFYKENDAIGTFLMSAATKRDKDMLAQATDKDWRLKPAHDGLTAHMEAFTAFTYENEYHREKQGYVTDAEYAELIRLAAKLRACRLDRLRQAQEKADREAAEEKAKREAAAQASQPVPPAVVAQVVPETEGELV